MAKNKSPKNNSFSNLKTGDKLAKKLELLRKLMQEIEEETSLDFTSISKQVKELQSSVPSTIFSKELTVLESAIIYLREQRGLSNKEVSERLKRDQREVYAAYSRAVKKGTAHETEESAKRIPLSVFEKGILSPLESVVHYMKQQGLNFREIGHALKKDERTVWTVWNRARRKQDAS